MILLLCAGVAAGREQVPAPEPVGAHTAVLAEDNAPLPGAPDTPAAASAEPAAAARAFRSPLAPAASGTLPAAWADRFDDIGGDDIVVASAERMGDSDLVIAGSGEIFVAVAVQTIVSGGEIRVYRSTNDGDTFDLWAQLTDPSPDIEFSEPSLELGEGYDDRLFLAYTYRAPDQADQVHVTYAEAFAGTGDFGATLAVLATPGIDFGAPSLASDSVVYNDYYLYLVAEGQDDSGQDIWFARCTNRGLSFETPYRIGNLTTDARGYYRPDVCWGQSGWVHVTWCFRYDAQAQDIAVRYRRAPSSAAGGDANWHPIARLSTNDNGLDEYCPHVAASPESPHVAIVYSRRQYVEASADYDLLPPGFLGSDDNGFWFSTSQILDGSVAVMNDLVYQGALDEFAAVGLSDGGPAVFRADRAVLDAWSGPEVFADQAYAVDEAWCSALAVNPAHGDQLATSWSVGTVADVPNSHLCDGEWRYDPSPVAGDALVARIRFAAPAPNPTSGATLFAYALPVPGRVSLEVYDARGRRVGAVLKMDATAGDHVIDWNGRGPDGQPLASGIYVARLHAQTPQGERTLSRKLNLIR